MAAVRPSIPTIRQGAGAHRIPGRCPRRTSAWRTRRAPPPGALAGPSGGVRAAAPARARLRATAAAMRRRAVSLERPAHPPARPPVQSGRLFQLAGIALLGLVALISAAPVQAQSVTPLVSNFGQGGDSGTFTRGVRAQSFNTGWNATGYTLHSVDVRVESAETIPGSAQRRFAMCVCPATAEGFPPVRAAEIIPTHTACVALTPPSSFAGDPATLTFTAPANTRLQRGTHYTVVNIATSGTPLYDATLSDSEDGGGASGWAIAVGTSGTTATPASEGTCAPERDLTSAAVFTS